MKHFFLSASWLILLFFCSELHTFSFQTQNNWSEKKSFFPMDTDSLRKADSLLLPPSFWKPKLKYGVSMSFDLARGNSNYMSLLPKADALIEAGILGLQTSFGYNLTRMEGNLVNSDFLFNMTPSVSLGKKIRLNGLIGAQATPTRNIGQRERKGIGLGIPFQKKENNRLNANISGVQEETNYLPDENGELSFSNGLTAFSRKTFGVQLSSNGQLTIGENGLGINYDTFFMKSLNVKDDFRMGVALDFLVPISKKIGFQTHFNYSYENIIPIGTHHQDVFITFGVGYREL